RQPRRPRPSNDRTRPHRPRLPGRPRRLGHGGDRVTAAEDYAPHPDDEAEAGPHLGAVPDYPVDAIPGPLGDLIREADRAGLPTALVAGAGLTVAATVAMPASVEVGGNTWVEP